MNLPKERLQNGDTLMCYSNGWLGRQIRSWSQKEMNFAHGLLAPNHAAKVVKIGNILMVADSQRHGTNLITFENWVETYSYNYRVYRNRYTSKEWGAEIREKILSKCGHSSYDFKGTFFYQPLLKLTGKWYGKTEAEAAEKLYCSEFAGLVDNVPEWWMKSPAALEMYYIESPNYIHVT